MTKSTVSVELLVIIHNDSRAIALTKIGYFVKEALDCVHDANATKRIKSVKFAWANKWSIGPTVDQTLQLKGSGA